jgi:hypothetical protein
VEEVKVWQIFVVDSDGAREDDPRIEWPAGTPVQPLSKDGDAPIITAPFFRSTPIPTRRSTHASRGKEIAGCHWASAYRYSASSRDNGQFAEFATLDPIRSFPVNAIET